MVVILNSGGFISIVNTLKPRNINYDKGYKVVNTKKLYNNTVAKMIELEDFDRSQFAHDGFSIACTRPIDRSVLDSPSLAVLIAKGFNRSVEAFDIKDPLVLKGQKNLLRTSFVEIIIRGYNNIDRYWREMEKDPEKWGLKCL